MVIPELTHVIAENTAQWLTSREDDTGVYILVVDQNHKHVGFMLSNKAHYDLLRINLEKGS